MKVLEIERQPGIWQGYFTQNLEQAERDLVGDRKMVRYSFAVTDLLESDVAMTLEQMGRLRELHRQQLSSLRRTECYVDTELMQMEERAPRYSPYRFPEREKFQSRLFLIETERRKGAIFYEERMQGLQRKLLSLMQKHEQLSVGELRT